MSQRNLRPWFVAKSNKHVLNGIENPENWKWELREGTFYPVEEIVVKVESEESKQMFEDLNPDWTVEEMEANGWEVLHEMEYGSEAVMEYREGCGH